MLYKVLVSHLRMAHGWTDLYVVEASSEERAREKMEPETTGSRTSIELEVIDPQAPVLIAEEV